MGLTFLEWERLRKTTKEKNPLRWPYHAKGQTWRTKVMLHGMTDKPAAALTPLAKSWLHAPELTVNGPRYTSKGYDRTSRSYRLVPGGAAGPAKLSIRIAASEDRPVIRPAFLIENWGEHGASLSVNDKQMKRGTDFRLGHRRTLDGSDLIIWIRVESAQPMTMVLSPTKQTE